MNKSNMGNAASFVVSEVCLLVFLQKFLYGYAITSFPTKLLFGSVAYNHITSTMVTLIPVTLLYVLVSKRTNRVLESKKGVAAAGCVSLVVLAYVLFDIRLLLPHEAGETLLWTCTILVCCCFCVIFFAWSNRIESLEKSWGARNVLTLLLCACFVYCMITPSDGNSSPYTIAIELVSLPLAALLFAVSPKTSEGSAAGNASAKKGSHAFMALTALLFLVVLSITYVDHLNANFPLENFEQPTMYALLLMTIAAITAMLHFGEKDADGLKARAILIVWAVLTLYFVMYLVVFWLSSSSVDFDFHLTCTLRRLVVMTFYAAIVFLALAYRIRMAIALVFCFLMPFLVARIVMRTLYYSINMGVIADSLELRLALLLVLGIAFVLLISAGLFAGYVSEQRKFADKKAESSSADRQAAVEQLSKRYRLSSRECETLYYLSLGYSVNRIAETLFIASNTVASHSRSIYKKMDLHNKQDVIDIVNEAISDQTSRVS